MTIRALIVDDEQPARERLRRYLSTADDVAIVGEAADGLEAVDAIRRLSPDLVFLDVQMPGLDGFDVLEAVGTAVPAVVFVTAYDQYAIPAFDAEAADYLLKPYDDDRFARALTRARQRVQTASADSTSTRTLEQVLARLRPSRGFLQRLVVDDRDRVRLVPVRDIFRISAEGNYARVHTAGGTSLVRHSLTYLDSRLDHARFARIHRSDIVAIDAVCELQPVSHGDYDVLLKNGDRVRLSRRFHHRLLKTDETA